LYKDNDNPAKTWTFDNNGNLTLPTGANINYANGVSILSGLGGTGRDVIYTAPDIGGLEFANVNSASYGSMTVIDGVMRAATVSGFTATVTSRNRLVLTNGDSTLSAGNDIYLTANLETSSQSWKFGANGSLRLPQPGQVINNGQLWTFGSDSILATPGGIYVPSGDSSPGLTFSPDRTSSVGRISVDTGNNMTVNSTGSYSVKVSSYDRVYISTNTTTVLAGQDLVLKSNKNATEKVWTFGANGASTFPGNITVPGNSSNIAGFAFYNGDPISIVATAPIWALSFMSPYYIEIAKTGLPAGFDTLLGSGAWTATANASTFTVVSVVPNGDYWRITVAENPNGIMPATATFNRAASGANIVIPAGGNVVTSSGSMYSIRLAQLKSIVASSATWGEFQANIAAL